MPTARYNWRQNLSAPRVTPEQLMAQQQAQNLALQKAGQFPLENAVRQAALSRAQSSEAASNYKLQKEIETDRQKTAFYNGLQELETNLNAKGMPIGSQGHAEAFAAYAHEFPLARSSKDVQDALKLHSLINDDQASLTNRMVQSINATKDAMQQTGQNLVPQGASFIKGGGVDVRLAAPQAGASIPVQAAARYAKLQGDIAQFQNDPANANALNGALVESDMLENRYPQLKVPSLPQQTVFPDDGTTSPTATPSPASPVNTPTPQEQSAISPPDHSAAIDWANANPNDPRSQVILQTAQSALAAQQPQVQPVPGQYATAEPDTTPEEEQ